MTLLDSYSYDIDKDGTDEEIKLYTAAQKDENGIMMWDDGQTFILDVDDGTVSYELFNEYVQIGRVYFAVEGGEKTGIILTVSTYAGIRMDYYGYSSDDTAFIKKTMFGTDDLNIVFSSFPWD
jgi:hypothetical protein